MKITLSKATQEDKSTIQNLGRFYVYEMSRYCGFLPTWETPSNGLFECIDLSSYCEKPDRHAFLVKADAELAGFVLINKVGSTPDVDWNIGEFFIVSKFQGKGVGRHVAEQVFNQFPGVWETSQIPENKAKKDQTDCDEPEPIRRRFHTDAPTVASLKKLFSSNQRGVLLRTDETSAQLQKFDKDGCEGDRAFFLSCWSGQETYHDDRMTRASLLDLSLCLAWMGGIQPNTLKHYLQQATHATKGSDGLMQRFQLICYPVVDQEFKDVNIQIPAELKAEIKQLSIDLDRLCTGEKILRFEAEAQKAFVDWYVQHQNLTEMKMRNTGKVIWEKFLSLLALFVLSCIWLKISRLVEKIACLAWRQRRAVQAESSLFHKGLSNE